jgi:multidrug efflux pump subunit AcrB
MNVEVITLQSELVTASISGFIVNLLQAVAIVVVVLLVFMGLRSGLIIGSVLFLTISGTFIFMSMWGVILERISLGALIIALGMLVDNAIVVADGMKVRMKAGKDALTAAKEVAGQTAMPLLGATAVAVLAFASIGTSQDATGEFCRSLFQVILISLTLSWVTAVTLTPLFCARFLMGKRKAKEGAAADAPPADPYGGKFYSGYRRFLETCIRARWVSAGVVAAVFAVSLWGFGFVKKSFFPDSTRDQFFVQFYFPEGMHIEETERRMGAVEAHVRAMEGVEHISTIVGGGHLRFLLTYQPERPSTSFGEILVTVDDYHRIAGQVAQCQREFEEMFPEAIINARMFLLGPGEGGKIQLRIYGPDPQELRRLARVAEDIMRADPGAKAVRNESKEQVKVVRPVLAEAQARRAGLERSDVARAVQAAFAGARTGIYREGEELLPILARAPESERLDVDNLRNVQIWSPVAGRMIPLQQVVSSYETTWEDANIMRWNRATTIRLHCDPRDELASTVFARIKPQIEKALGVDVAAVTGKRAGEGDDPYAGLTATTIPVRDEGTLPLAGKPGYAMAWGGQAEDSARAGAALAGSIPVFVMMMVLIIIILFNSIRQPLVIWLCVPLALIGVTGGLLLSGQPFGFMSLLGLLSLSGMLIKNAIVLVDEINANTGGGMSRYDAIVAAGVSRVMPVSMAALTTILGMAPLLKDAFFVAMAVTIMAGLGVATVLTLLVLPVFYSIICRVPSPPR